MPNPNSFSAPKDNYDPRWFIWTIVFLLVTGISLVSYILLSDTTSAESDPGVSSVHHATSTVQKVK